MCNQIGSLLREKDPISQVAKKKKKSVLNVSPIPQPVSIARQASEDASSPQQLSCKSQVSDLLPKAPDTLELIAIAAVL